MIDIDHFKSVNDTYGHACGNTVLCQVAKQLSCVTREYDIAGRLGGEEFCIILPNTASDAPGILDRVRARIEATPCRHHDETLWVTISAGTATSTLENLIDPEQLLDRADQALYRAKNSGRNRVIPFITEVRHEAGLCAVS
jgi:diguanylate cyclase (GGDEF)-like protein